MTQISLSTKDQLKNLLEDLKSKIQIESINVKENV